MRLQTSSWPWLQCMKTQLGVEDPLQHGSVIQLLAESVFTMCLSLRLSWQRICLQCGRPGFDPWIGKIPWRRERLPTPVLWPGEFLGPCSLWSHRDPDPTERLSLHHVSSIGLLESPHCVQVSPISSETCERAQEERSNAFY